MMTTKEKTYGTPETGTNFIINLVGVTFFFPVDQYSGGLSVDYFWIYNPGGSPKKIKDRVYIPMGSSKNINVMVYALFGG